MFWATGSSVLIQAPMVLVHSATSGPSMNVSARATLRTGDSNPGTPMLARKYPCSLSSQSSASSRFPVKVRGAVPIVRTSAAAAIGTCAGGAAGFGGAPPPPGGPGAPSPPPPEGAPPGPPPPPERLKAALKAIWICCTRSTAGVDEVVEVDAGGGPDLPPPVVVVVVVCVWVAMSWGGKNLAGRMGLSVGATSGGRGMDAGSGVLIGSWIGSLSQTSLQESSDSLAESTSVLTGQGSS